MSGRKWLLAVPAIFLFLLSACATSGSRPEVKSDPRLIQAPAGGIDSIGYGPVAHLGPTTYK